jgi:hypothetical protein
LGFGGGLLLDWVYPPRGGWFNFPVLCLIGAVYMGGAGLAVGVLGGGLIAWSKVARARSFGSAFRRAVLVTTLLGMALGFGGGLLMDCLWGGWGILWLCGAVLMGGAGLAVGLLGGGLVARSMVARAGCQATIAVPRATVPPPDKALPTTPQPATPTLSRRWLLVSLALAFIIITFAILFTVSRYDTRPHADREGTTWSHTELTDYLTSRGFKFTSLGVDSTHPSGPAGHFHVEFRSSYVGGPVFRTIFIQIKETAEEARKSADLNSLAWGRFYIKGDIESLAAIRRALALPDIISSTGITSPPPATTKGRPNDPPATPRPDDPH